MRHEHFHAEAAGVGVRTVHPAADVIDQVCRVLFEWERPYEVAGRPVVHIGEKHVERGNGFGIVLYLVYEHAVQVVLVEILMRKCAHELCRLRRSGKLLGIAADGGLADADDRLLRDGRQQTRVKVPVLLILKREELRLYRRHGFFTPP